LHEAYLYKGFKFSKQGYGPQWENAGSGAMALRLLQHRNTTDSIKSLVKLWKKYPTGVPAHFETEETKKVASADYQPNTGLSWSYYRKQHAASVFWTAAAVLENEGVVGLNLFGTGNPSRAKKTNPTVPFTDTQLDKVFTCNRPNIYSMTAGSVVVSAEKFGATTFSTPPCTEGTYTEIRSSFNSLLDCQWAHYYVSGNEIVVGEGTAHPEWGLCATILPAITDAGFQKCKDKKIVKQLSLGFDGTESLENLKKSCNENPDLPPGSVLRGPLTTCLDTTARAVILWKIKEECSV